MTLECVECVDCWTIHLPAGESKRCISDQFVFVSK